MVRIISYRPTKKVKIIRGLSTGEIAELDDVVVHKGKTYYKLVGFSGFYTPRDVRLIAKRRK